MEGADWVLPGTRSSSTAHAGRQSRDYVARTAPSTSWPRRAVLPTTAFESTSSHSSETASSVSVAQCDLAAVVASPPMSTN
jgi:hypothetical protein